MSAMPRQKLLFAVALSVLFEAEKAGGGGEVFGVGLVPSSLRRRRIDNLQTLNKIFFFVLGLKYGIKLSKEKK